MAEISKPNDGGLGPCPFPYSRRWGIGAIACNCNAPPCAACGFPKHAAVHLILADAEPGSRPYDHVYTPEKQQ